jgi:hypothetical protein
MSIPSHRWPGLDPTLTKWPVPRGPLKLFVRFSPGVAVAMIGTALFAATAIAANETREHSPSFDSRFSGQRPHFAEQPTVTQSSNDDHATRQLERREIDDLIRRGTEFIVRGDLASARLVLQRAAEAGASKAALLLAGTYDPIVLQRVGIQGFAADIVQGFAPDAALARTWYERAKELGSAEASRRLEALTGQKDHGVAPKD